MGRHSRLLLSRFLTVDVLKKDSNCVKFCDAPYDGGQTEKEKLEHLSPED